MSDPAQTARIAPLAEDVRAFHALTFPKIGKRLASPDALPPRLLAVGAWVGDAPVGLAYGGGPNAQGEAWLISVMVHPAFRRRGVADALLKGFEDEARARGAKSVFVHYARSIKMAAAFERAIARRGWRPPAAFEISLIGETGKMVPIVGAWAGVRHLLDGAGEYSFPAWGPFSDEDRAQLAWLKGQPACTDNFHFEQIEARIDPVCSLLVRRSGRLVGWVVAVPSDNAALGPYGDRVGRYYHCAYIDEALWRSAVMIAAYHHCFARQMAAYGGASVAHYHSNMPGQVALSRRRFAPIALRFDENFKSEIAL